MSERTDHPAKPDYGLDAPGVVRNLLLAAGFGFLLRIVVATGVWSGVVAVGPVAFPLGHIGLYVAIVCAAMAAWMVWETKVRNRERRYD